MQLPDILKVAEEYKLTFDPSTHGKKETRCKCPFCKEDSLPGKEKKYYLSLNTEDHLFKCWFCKESGGAFRFISLLSDTPEDEVIQIWKKKHRGKKYKPHPAERLTNNQFRLLGYDKKPNWHEMRMRDSEYYKRTRSYLYKEWKAFLKSEKRWAYMLLLTGIRSMSYQKVIGFIQEREKEIGTSLLNDVLKIYSLSNRPSWCLEAERFVEHLFQPNKEAASKVYKINPY